MVWLFDDFVLVAILGNMLFQMPLYAKDMKYILCVNYDLVISKYD